MSFLSEVFVSESAQNSNEPKILGAFISVAGLLSVALYFTGWIYRYAYYGSFRIEVNALNLPAQSFFFVPLSVFLGSPWALLKGLLVITLTILVIILGQVGWKRILHRFRFHFGTKGFLPTLLRDLIVIGLILVSLYWLARSQGEADAQRDAISGKSVLPLIALVHPEKDLGIGRNPKKTFDEPALQKDSTQQKTRIIGDIELFNKLREIDIKASDDPPQLGDWRLLVSSNGWLYLIRTLPEDQVRKKDGRFPIVLAVREGGGEQLMILSSPP